jgi:hypothetical protein
MEIPYKKKFSHHEQVFVVHRPLLPGGKVGTESWCVSEFTTGLCCCDNEKTIKETIELFKQGCPDKKELDEQIKHYVNKFGITN